MNTLKLYICDFESHSEKDLRPAPGEVSAWLKTLPMGDTATAAAQLFNLLHQYNQCELPALTRFEVLESLQSAVNQSCRALSIEYTNNALPLSERNRQRFHLSSGLFEQLAIGYKTIVLDLYNDSANNQNTHALFLTVIHKTIKQLARLLLECYTVYAKEPDDIWGELNRLYQLSDSLSTNPSGLIPQDSGQTTTQTIETAYLRIALLSVVNPYHLMQGEAVVLYDYLKKWAKGCRLQKIVDYNQLKNDLVIMEFNRSQAPQFYYENRSVNIVYARTINLSGLLDQFNDTLTKMSDHLTSDSAQKPFNEHMRRDMLLRIQRVWQERQTRKQHREQTNEYLVLAMGINVVHHFILDQHAYTPETHEIKYYQPDGINKHVSTDLTFWKSLHDCQAFCVEQRDRSIQTYKKTRWMLFNQSENGIGLRCDGICNSSVRVGDIIAYKKSIDVAGWHAGVVRWVKDLDKNVLELGINIINGVPRAVSVRHVDQDIKLGYLRCLLLELHSRGQTYVTLITPASTFKVGSQILINSQDQMKYAKISGLVTLTTSYAQFEFEVIPTPMKEQTKINTILGT